MWELNKPLTFPAVSRGKMRGKKKQGISLIEVIIATGILSVGILGLINAFPQGIETTREQELAIIAGQIAQTKLEEIASLSYAEVIPGTIENKARTVADLSSPLYKFLRSTTAELVDQNLNSSITDIGLKKITVTVYWPSVFNLMEKSQTVVALISER